MLADGLGGVLVGVRLFDGAAAVLLAIVVESLALFLIGRCSLSRAMALAGIANIVSALVGMFPVLSGALTDSWNFEADPWVTPASHKSYLLHHVLRAFLVTLVVEAPVLSLLNRTRLGGIRWLRLLIAFVLGNVVSYAIIGGYVLSFPPLTGNCRFEPNTHWINECAIRIWFVDPSTRQLCSIQPNGSDRRIELVEPLARHDGVWGTFSNYVFCSDRSMLAYEDSDGHWAMLSGGVHRTLPDIVAPGAGWPRTLAELPESIRSRPGLTDNAARLLGYSSHEFNNPKRAYGDRLYGACLADFGMMARNSGPVRMSEAAQFRVHRGLCGLVCYEPKLIESCGLLVFRCGGWILVMDVAARRVGCLVRGDSMSTEEPDPSVATAPASAPAPIPEFQGEYRFLSNFWPAEVHFEGIVYPSSEHAYQAAKSLDPAERKRIAALATPSAAKKAGAALKLRPNWDTEKFKIMETVVRDKFSRNADLRMKLLATGDAELIEGNTWGDRTWGVFEGKGENRLGKILMKIRAELRNAPATQPAAKAPASQGSG